MVSLLMGTEWGEPLDINEVLWWLPLAKELLGGCSAYPKNGSYLAHTMSLRLLFQ
jgi:hypothetical protein